MKRKQATLKTRKSLTGPFRRKKDDDDDADDDFRPTKAAAKSGAKKGAGPGEPLKAARAKLVKKEESDVDVDDFDYVKPAATTKRTAAAAAKKKPESDDDAEEENRKPAPAKKVVKDESDSEVDLMDIKPKAKPVPKKKKQ